MVEIEFYDDDVITKGILLGKYRRMKDEVYSYEKKFLWKTKTIYKQQVLNTTLYVVFVPWQHQLKELREVDEKYIVNPQAIQPDESWIRKESFISETDDGYFYPSSLEINDFVGYKFMCDNNSFIANLCLHNFDECLTVLYNNAPEFLNADLCNTEEF